MTRISLSILVIVLLAQAKTQANELVSGAFLRSCIEEELRLDSEHRNLKDTKAQVNQLRQELTSTNRQLDHLESDVYSKRNWYRGCLSRHGYGQCSMARLDKERAEASYEQVHRQHREKARRLVEFSERALQTLRRLDQDEHRLKARCLTDYIETTNENLDRYCLGSKEARHTHFCSRFSYVRDAR